MNGANIRIIIGVCIAIIMIGYAFMSNSSPYVTIQEARKLKGTNLHLAGDLVDGSFEHIPSKKAIGFAIRDADGNAISVLYTGEQPANMSQVNKIVAIGGIKDNVFHAHKLLIKCPSKYESENKQDPSVTKGVKSGS